MLLGLLAPAILEKAGVNRNNTVGYFAELLGSALFAEKGYFHVLTIIFYGLDRSGKIIIPGNEDGDIIIILVTMCNHIGGQLDIRAFFIRRDVRPLTGINETTKA